MSLISLPQNPAPLTERLHDAVAVTPALLADVVREACRRFPSQVQAGKTERIGQLIEMGAWTDAALALIELELPQWHVRRIAYDDGEWYCALSRVCELPDWLDDSAEGRHADLPLAILSAFVETQQSDRATIDRAGAPETGPGENWRYEPVVCDNFA